MNKSCFKNKLIDYLNPQNSMLACGFLICEHLSLIRPFFNRELSASYGKKYNIVHLYALNILWIFYDT